MVHLQWVLVAAVVNVVVVSASFNLYICNGRGLIRDLNGRRTVSVVIKP